jgi:hypothetical protein
MTRTVGGMAEMAGRRVAWVFPDANKPGKAETLAQAGARAAVTDLAEITTALRTSRTSPSTALADGRKKP